MKRPLSRLVVVLAVSVLVWCPAAWAQARTQEQQQQQEQAQAQEPELPVIELTFGGGTVGEYVEAVRNAFGEPNIVVTAPQARNIALPPIQLQSVDLGTAMDLLEGRYQMDDGRPIQLNVLEIGSWSEGVKRVLKVVAQIQGPARPESQARVWTVADVLAAEVPSEALLTAIETALELMVENRDPAQVRFHEATGLLIARGDRWQMEAIEAVVRELREGLDRRREVEQQEAGREDEEKASQRVKELEDELRGRMLEIERLAVRCEVIQKERERLEVERRELQNVLRQHEAVIQELQARPQ